VPLLHWLPVKHRIACKTAVLTHKVLTTSTLPYLHDMLTVATPARPMRSTGAPLLSVQRVRTEFARRAFLLLDQQSTTRCLPTFNTQL